MPSDAPTSFIDSGFTTKVEYEAWLATPRGSSVAAVSLMPTLGYWKIRGLAAACRMMFYYKGKSYKEVAYGEDAKVEWFGGDKKALAEKNPMMNLPYIVDGETVVTQSNSCLIYLGQVLGIDQADCMVHNHQAMDQTMDLRNDLMKIVYGPAGKDFKAALTGHMGGASKHFAKLNGFCKGPYTCGSAIQSADFHIFEMLDQHVKMCTETGVAFELETAFPKLAALHRTMKADPKLAKYFASDPYTKYAVNNAMYANYNGAHYKGPYGPTIRVEVTL